MPQIQATVPVLVQQIQVEKNLEYKLSPVFFSYPEVYHRRYEQAVSRFGREVREHFKNFEINRHNSSELLWYMFAPPLKHKIVQMEFMAGKQLISGQFSVIYFNLQGKTFVCLPGFSAFVFLADSSNPTEIFAQARTVIEKLLREYKKRDNETTWDMTPHYAIKNEFVTTLDFNIQVGDSKFGFEKSESSDFFAFFGGLSTFDGAAEISKVGQNLNEVPMGELKRAFFREDLLEQLQPIYNQTENTPLALVGADGVGKHSLIHELVARYRTQMSEKETPNDTWTQIWHIDPTRIIAGMSIVGMWQRRLEAILTHIQTRISEACKVYNMPATDRKDKILIDNPVALLRIGKSAQNSMTLSDVLKPYLEKRSFQIILLASPEEWKLIQEKDRRLADLFQVIRVPEPPYETAVKMMLQQRKVLEITHNCTINIPAIRQLFNIHKYYFKRRALPGSVARMLNQLSVKYANQTIDSEEVQNEFREYSGLNVQMLDDNFVLEKNVLERQLSEKLIGQAAAVETLANVVHTIKSKLANPNRPLGSFLFIGPTGVGKTEAAKLVCERILGGADKLMRFDMNEYIDEWSVSRLIGDYYNPEGQLTGKIRYNPFGVLLFDEIEKAHPKIHDLLLQVLDDGRLTDSIGRTVDFTNTIIIMTSNIGAQQVSHQLGFESEARQDTAIYHKAVENFFRPEFINRIDKIVIFNNLQLEHILEIAKLQINNLLSRDGFVRRTTILNISNEALDWVAKRGYNSRMGGRSLKRQIEKDLTVFTADQLVQTGADQPIIFDIQIKDNQLCPRIEALKFAQPLPDGWLPLLPNEKEAQSAYRELFRQVERLEKQVAQSQTQINDKNGGKTDWQFYDYTNQIAEKKEKLNRLLMGFRSSYIDNIPSNLLRLKGSSASSVIYNNNNNKRSLEKILISDKLFQQSALEEISFGYQHAPEQFDKSQGLYLSDFMDIALMQKIAPFAQRRQLQHLFLRVRSAIDNTGKEEMEFLLGMYKEVLESLSIGVTVDEKNACLELKGYAIQELLDKEQGYHFFYRSRQNPLPIRAWLAPDANTNPPTDIVPEVVRLYDIWMGKNHKSSTITDLRTGFTNQADIDPQEFKMFLFAK